MRSMSSRSRARLLASGAAAAAVAAVLAGCGGATVDGQAPEITAEAPTSSSAPASVTPFAEERPEKPTGPVPPPPPQSPAPEPMPGEPEPPPAAESAPQPPAPEPVPGAGDFVALLNGRGVVLPEGMDPVGTAVEACARFDGGQQMDEVSGWLADQAGLDPDGQGFFLGAAVTTYCPADFPKLG